MGWLRRRTATDAALRSEIGFILHNGGSCFLPLRMAEPFIDAGRLNRVPHSPQYLQPVYAVYLRDSENPLLALALEGLRQHAARFAGGVLEI